MNEKLLNLGRKLRRFPRLHRKTVSFVNAVRSPWLLQNWFKVHVFSFFRLMKISWAYKPYYNIESVKNRHLGKRCFVIGTGPSLTISDLEKLKDEITIGMNSIFLAYDQTDFRPTYYTVLDPDNYTNFGNEKKYQYLNRSKREVFLNDVMKKALKKQVISTKTVFLIMDWMGHWINSYSTKIDFSDDLLKKLCDGYNTAYAAIQIMAYMGCKEIYLLGIDGGRKKGEIHFIPNHFDEKADKYCYDKDQSDRSFEYAERYSRENGFRIYNATRGGWVEAFERVDLDEVLKEPAQK